MDLLKKKWRARGNIKTEFRDGKLLIENNAGKHGFLVYPKLFRSNGEKEVTLCLEGKLLEGTGCTLKLLNRHRTIMGTCGLNSVFVNKFIWLKYFILVLYVPPYSKMELTKADYLPQADENLLVNRYLHGDVLVATPGYPSLENKYNSAFVHTRVKAYQQLGWNVEWTNARYFYSENPNSELDGSDAMEIPWENGVITVDAGVKNDQWVCNAVCLSPAADGKRCAELSRTARRRSEAPLRLRGFLAGRGQQPDQAGCLQEQCPDLARDRFIHCPERRGGVGNHGPEAGRCCFRCKSGRCIPHPGLAHGKRQRIRSEYSAVGGIYLAGI